MRDVALRLKGFMIESDRAYASGCNITAPECDVLSLFVDWPIL